MAQSADIWDELITSLEHGKGGFHAVKAPAADPAKGDRQKAAGVKMASEVQAAAEIASAFGITKAAEAAIDVDQGSSPVGAGASDSAISAYEMALDCQMAEAANADGEDVLRQYCQRRALCRQERYGKTAFPINGHAGRVAAGTGPSVDLVRAELQRELGAQRRDSQEPCDASREGSAVARDSDGERLVLCARCRLPVGNFAYARDDGTGALLHGECMAQLLLSDNKREDEARLEDDAAKKREKRKEYDIGWKVDRIPQNAGLTGKIECPPILKGMCCLVLDEPSNRVCLAPTAEPSAAVNLAYLSLALQVRLSEGTEPVFSLDPVDNDPSASMQVKRFEPAWLAGTCVGEVLFQADYHLKELSMGEYEQPVVGMRSCFDLCEGEWKDKAWNAREWFVVRKAEVQLSEDNVLIPFVRMGVEAREQVQGPNGLEDARVTTSGHPLVKYAEMFSERFDLIAERKGVVHQLREVAKASIMAKHLDEANADLEDYWFELVNKGSKTSCITQVPQLWNERLYSQIQVQDGKIVKEAGMKPRGVYGGVAFGLQRFQMTKAKPVGVPTSGTTMRMASDFAPAWQPRMTMARRSVPPSVSVVAKPAAVVEAASQPTVEPAFQPAMSVAQRRAAPAWQPSTEQAAASFGLDSFRVSRASRVAPAGAVSAVSQVIPAVPAFRPRFTVASPAGAPGTLALRGAPGGGLMGQQRVAPAFQPRMIVAGQRSPMLLSWQPNANVMGQRGAIMPRGVDLNLGDFDLSAHTRSEGKALVQSPDACAAMGKAFWSCVESAPKSSYFEEEDRDLLLAVFNPHCSDRREEGDAFVPPDTSVDYVDKLRTLVKEEEAVRRQRKEHFFSSKFSMDDAGPLFPSTWSSTFKLANRQEPRAAGGSVHARPEYMAQAPVINHALKSATSVFDKVSEDGTRYRIYRIGSLEVRTCQEHNAKEVVGAVFSIRPSRQTSAGGQQEQCVEESDQVVKVVEYVESAQGGATEEAPLSLRFQSYVVLETERGSTVVTERCRDGTVTWEENPEDLEDRSSLAKVIRSADCRALRTTVGDMKLYREQESNLSTSGALHSQSRQYAQGAYTFASGEQKRYSETTDLVKTYSELQQVLWKGGQKVDAAKGKAAVRAVEEAEDAAPGATSRCTACGRSRGVAAGSGSELCGSCQQAWESGVDNSLD